MRIGPVVAGFVAGMILALGVSLPTTQAETKSEPIRVPAARPQSDLPSQQDLLGRRMDQLTARVAAAESRLAVQENTIGILESRTKPTHPAGYAPGFVTLANWGNLSPRDAISYWRRE